MSPKFFHRLPTSLSWQNFNRRIFGICHFRPKLACGLPANIVVAIKRPNMTIFLSRTERNEAERSENFFSRPNPRPTTDTRPLKLQRLTNQRSDNAPPGFAPLPNRTVTIKNPSTVLKTSFQKSPSYYSVAGAKLFADWLRAPS